MDTPLGANRSFEREALLVIVAVPSGHPFRHAEKPMLDKELDDAAGFVAPVRDDSAKFLFREVLPRQVVLGLLGRGFKVALDQGGYLRISGRKKLMNAFYRTWSRKVQWHGRTGFFC